MIPSLVFSAQELWNLEPTKYRLSKTLAGAAYHVLRAGAGPGATSRIAVGSGVGATQRRATVPVKSNPAALRAAARCASIMLVLFCAKSAGPGNAAARSIMQARRIFMHGMIYDFASE